MSTGLIKIVVTGRFDVDGLPMYRASIEGKPQFGEEAESREKAVGSLVIWHGQELGLRVLPTVPAAPKGD